MIRDAIIRSQTSALDCYLYTVAMPRTPAPRPVYDESSFGHKTRHTYETSLNRNWQAATTTSRPDHRTINITDHRRTGRGISTAGVQTSSQWRALVTCHVTYPNQRRAPLRLLQITNDLSCGPDASHLGHQQSTISIQLRNCWVGRTRNTGQKADAKLTRSRPENCFAIARTHAQSDGQLKT